MSDLFNTGIRPIIDAHIEAEAAKIRDYGNYWSASSAGYCMRLNIMRRLGVPQVPEIDEKRATTQRVFSSGHIFHEWIQKLTRDVGVSIAQEVELQNEDLMIRGHFDDLILLGDSLILYDYKTAHSASFNYKKARPEIGHYHKMQLATYMYMLRGEAGLDLGISVGQRIKDLTEARILSISKDDLRLHEDQLMWSEELEHEVVTYWKTLNKYWDERKMPPCTCLEHDGGFMGRRSSKGKVYNDFFWEDEPCSITWYELCKKEGKL